MNMIRWWFVLTLNESGGKMTSHRRLKYIGLVAKLFCYHGLQSFAMASCSAPHVRVLGDRNWTYGQIPLVFEGPDIFLLKTY